MSPAATLRVALITGAGTGIGKAVSQALAADGFSVVLAGRRVELLQAGARDLTNAGHRSLAVPTDVASEPSVRELFARVRAEFGRLDLLFNNAGTSTRALPIEELPLAEWQKVINVNLTGAFLCTQEAIKMMKAQSPPGGRIINNGSISAHTPRLNSAAYTASKHAISGLTKSTALDCRPHGIACGQIDIGNADTAIGSHVSSGALQADGSRQVEPLMDVQHVADAVRYMAGLPLDANVLTMTVMATGMPFVGRG
jgi:NAD(P)-dependent dehydrogenase (short-subunit alcohol dehydrogenase family)